MSAVLEIRLLATKGHRVTVIGDKQFWKLVKSPSRSRKTKRVGKATRRA